MTALAYLGATNVMLAIFNVIPAAPLDGGRLLRAVIWWRTGDRVKATVWASRAGQVFGTICIVGGLYLFFLTRDWSWLWISLTGWFLTGAATAEAQQAVLAGRLRGIRASQIVTPDPVTVPGSMTVSEFIDDYMFRARHQSFPVTRDGTDTVCGLVTLDRIKHVPGRPARRHPAGGHRLPARRRRHRRTGGLGGRPAAPPCEPRRLEHASAAVDCLAAPGT